MIYKHYETNKIKLNKLILIYGKNNGLKNEVIKNLLKDKNIISNYDEKEIIDDPEIFFEQILSKSLFEDEKIIIIKRGTDKLLKIIKEINLNILDNVVIIVVADSLEKKSKLRSEFEKNKNMVCVAVYPDDNKTLLRLSMDFLEKNKLRLSSSNINLIINKCDGDREKLINEFQKIKLFSAEGKKISSESINKLVNLGENHSISELVDNCLAKNEKRAIYILNENNFTNEDCIIITKTFLNKSKKIQELISNFIINKNIETTISSAKPPIFWKDKEITKQQIFKWSPESIKLLIYKLNEIELLIKKNLKISIYIIIDFILEQSSSKTNN